MPRKNSYIFEKYILLAQQNEDKEHEHIDYITSYASTETSDFHVRL